MILDNLTNLTIPTPPANPMLAAHITPDQLSGILPERFPSVLTPKVDGVRLLVGIGANQGSIYTRSLKELPNRILANYLIQWASIQRPDLASLATYLEVEVQYKSSFQRTTSLVTSRDQDFDAGYLLVYAFDYQPKDILEDYASRINHLDLLIMDTKCANLEVSPISVINNLDELTAYVASLPTQGVTVYNEFNYPIEGAVLRNPDAPYKNGRSTLLEAGMLAIVSYHTGEATLVDMYPAQVSTVASKVNELGYRQTSHRKDSKRSVNKLGAMMLEREDGITFKVGTGYTPIQAVHYWRNCEALIGSIVKYKYKELTEAGIPRHPVFLGIRAAEDLVTD